MDFRGRRILLVEDEFLVALDTSDTLKAAGCEVVGPATNLAAATRLAHTEALDAAVLDIDIAGEMVWPVAKELHRRGVPFVFVSAYTRQTMIPPPFAEAPRLEKPLVHDALLRHLGAMWAA